MAYEIINTGTLPNDGTGDPVRVAFIKINNNFAQTANIGLPGGPNGAIQIQLAEPVGNAISQSFIGSDQLVADLPNTAVNIGLNIIPLTDNTLDIGAPSKKVGNLYLGNTALHVGNITVSEVGNSLQFNLSGSNTAPNVVFGTVSYGTTTLNNTVFVTTSNTANQVAFSIPVSEISVGHFEITSRDANSSSSQTVTLRVEKSNDSTSVRHTATGTIFSGNVVTNYNADVAYSNVRVMVSPFTSNTVNHTIIYQITK